MTTTTETVMANATARKFEVVKVIREVRAWDLGADDWAGAANERARVKGGRGALYEEVWASAARTGRDVRLGRIEGRPGGLRPVTRWIDGDTVLEVVEVREIAPVEWTSNGHGGLVADVNGWTATVSPPETDDDIPPIARRDGWGWSIDRFANPDDDTDDRIESRGGEEPTKEKAMRAAEAAAKEE